MARHKVDIVNVNTAEIEVLSNDEMVKFFKEYQKGNQTAKERLVSGNLKLVLSILKKYNTRVDNMDDLFQVGVVGLIKAIDNFDLSHEVKFSTYAVPMILGEVKRYLRDNSSIRIARSIKDIAYKALKANEELVNKYGREVTVDEIAKYLDLEPYVVADALDAMKDTISMSEPIYNDGGDTIYLEDQLASNEGIYNLEIKMSLKDALNKIKNKERYILVNRYIIGKTQMELASELGISQAQISRLEKSGISSIKKMIN